MARKCVFCGERKVSKEHVIPQWVGTVLPKPPKERWRHKEQERVWATDHLDFTVKRVCRECNNGWMDQEIERRARPALTGMIHGQDMTLTRELQARVATWAVKTHAMAQFRPTHPRPISEELRTSLYERKVAPAQSRVWLAAYAGHATHGAWARTDNMELGPAVGENVRSDNASDVEIETMTLCIGHLVLHSVKWSLERLGATAQIDLPREHQLTQFLLPVWPVSAETQGWPPGATLGDQATLREFALALVPSEPPTEPRP